jgi:AraC-like DNA-binding protein
MAKTEERIQAVLRSIEYMKKNLDDEVTTEDLASEAGYSPYHFTRIFKEVTGVSPRHYLSALRIEAGKNLLIQSSSKSIVGTMLEIGFQSFGSFSSKFKQFVGLSPKKFQATAATLHEFMNEYDNAAHIEKSQDVKLQSIKCYIDFPADFIGWIFVGLFPRPIPDQKPIMGTAFSHSHKGCQFTDLPKGTYFVLAAAVPKSMNPADYFLLNKNLRGIAKKPVEVNLQTAEEVYIKLRKPMPYDPPILINLPRLLFEKEKKKAN